LSLKARISGNGDLLLIIAISLLLRLRCWLLLLEMAMIPLGIGFIAFVFVSHLPLCLFGMFFPQSLDNYLKIPLGAGIPDITFTRLTIITLWIDSVTDSNSK